MNQLKKLFDNDDRFFALLEASVMEAQNSIKLLNDMIKNPENSPTLDEFMQARNNDRHISMELTEELCKTFMTPLASEDIERLSLALYEIPETVKKFSEKFLLCRDYIQEMDFAKQINILDQATNIVVQMIKKLRSRSHIEELSNENDSLHALEHETEQLILEQRKNLNNSKQDSLKALTVLDLSEMLEEISDRCHLAGNIIFQIALKYS
ncbi:MAG: pit accessory protein [Kiritimatiellae bacterium]|nr:pit accessory protein [Kiritimatiellia bacterium]MDD5521636.1 pit accessory protein [Kiritimatiellia bacterium]